jgi:hypothetical protein
MKCVGKIAIGLAAGLALSAGARADNVVSADNPYTPIVTRNIFGLNPVQVEEVITDPPPKITLKGIMSANGNSQALYTVAGTGKPGQPAKDQSYILSEGQGQDDVEVTHINDRAGLVTFNNHGTVQDIPLANAPKITTSAPGGGPGERVSRPGFAGPGGGRGGGDGGNPLDASSRRGGAGRPSRGGGNDANQNSVAPGMGGAPITGGGLSVQSLQATPTRAGNADLQQGQPEQPALTPEETATLIEIQREAYRSQNNPIAGILPPTKFTPPGATGPTGNPLVMPVVPPPTAPAK